MACCGPPNELRDHDDWRYPRALEWKRLVSGDDVPLILAPSYERPLLPATTVEVPNPLHTRSAQQWFINLPDDTARAIMNTRRSMVREKEIMDSVFSMHPKPPARDPRPTADMVLHHLAAIRRYRMELAGVGAGGGGGRGRGRKQPAAPPLPPPGLEILPPTASMPPQQLQSGTQRVHQVGVNMRLSQPGAAPPHDPAMQSQPGGLPPPLSVIIARQQQQQQQQRQRRWSLQQSAGGAAPGQGQPPTPPPPPGKVAGFFRSISPFKGRAGAQSPQSQLPPQGQLQQLQEAGAAAGAPAGPWYKRMWRRGGSTAGAAPPADQAQAQALQQQPPQPQPLQPLPLQPQPLQVLGPGGILPQGAAPPQFLPPPGQPGQPYRPAGAGQYPGGPQSQLQLQQPYPGGQLQYPTQQLPYPGAQQQQQQQQQQPASPYPGMPPQLQQPQPQLQQQQQQLPLQAQAQYGRVPLQAQLQLPLQGMPPQAQFPGAGADPYQPYPPPPPRLSQQQQALQQPTYGSQSQVPLQQPQQPYGGQQAAVPYGGYGGYDTPADGGLAGAPVQQQQLLQQRLSASQQQQAGYPWQQPPPQPQLQLQQPYPGGPSGAPPGPFSPSLPTAAPAPLAPPLPPPPPPPAQYDYDDGYGLDTEVAGPMPPPATARLPPPPSGRRRAAVNVHDSSFGLGADVAEAEAEAPPPLPPVAPPALPAPWSLSAAARGGGGLVRGPAPLSYDTNDFNDLPAEPLEATAAAAEQRLGFAPPSRRQTPPSAALRAELRESPGPRRIQRRPSLDEPVGEIEDVEEEYGLGAETAGGGGGGAAAAGANRPLGLPAARQLAAEGPPGLDSFSFAAREARRGADGATPQKLKPIGLPPPRFATNAAMVAEDF